MRIEAEVGEVRGSATLAGRAEVQIVLTSRADNDLTITDEIRLASDSARWKMAERFAPPICDDAIAVLERLALEMAKVDRPAAVQTVTLADVQVEKVRWLWPGRLAYGKLGLIEGMPGTGKSQTTMALAAAVSRGFALPGGERAEPANVVMLTAEDGLGDTVRPRLEAAGGDPSRVHVIQGIAKEDGTYRFPGLPGDILPIASEIARLNARLLILDPLSAYLGGVNTFKDSEVRSALAPLAGIAEHTGAAAVVVRHLTKAPVGQAIVAGGGSIGIIGAARTALLLAIDPDDENRRVLAVVKNNLAKMPPSLSFRLEEQPSGWPCVVWEGESNHSADDLIAAGRNVEEGTRKDEARDFLTDLLSGGPIQASEVFRQARAAGHKDATIRRAQDDLKIKPVKVGGGSGSGWYWRLPVEVEDSHEGAAPIISRNMSIFPHEHVVSSDAPTSLEDAHPCASSLSIFPVDDDRPRCSLHGIRLTRKRSGITRCHVCSPPTSRDPYVEPLPNGGVAA